MKAREENVTFVSKVRDMHWTGYALWTCYAALVVSVSFGMYLLNI